MSSLSEEEVLAVNVEENGGREEEYGGSEQVEQA